MIELTIIEPPINLDQIAELIFNGLVREENKIVDLAPVGKQSMNHILT